MRGRINTGTGQRRTAASWREIVEGFAASGLSLQGYCARRGVGMASYQRWRRLLALPGQRAAGSALRSSTRLAAKTAAVSTVPAAPAFVDLGAIDAGGARSRVELRVDLGGGVVLQIARNG
jgi:hypothetical protein